MAKLIKNFFGADLVVTDETNYITLDEIGDVECWEIRPDYLLGEWRSGGSQGKAGWRPIIRPDLGFDFGGHNKFREYIRMHWCFHVSNLTVEPFQVSDYQVPPARLIEWYGRKIEVPQWTGYLALQPQTKTEDEKVYPLVAYELQPEWSNGHWCDGRLSLTVACVISPPVKPEDSLMKLKL